MVQPPQDDSHLRKSGAAYASMLRAQAQELECEAWDAPSEYDRVRIGQQADKLRAEADRAEHHDTLILF